MRKTLPLLLAALLVATAAPALADDGAQAGGHDAATATAPAHHDNETGDHQDDQTGNHEDNETDHETADANHTGREHRANMTEVRERHADRRAARDAFLENRTAALEKFLDAMLAARTSFLENKTAILDKCHEANATNASCVRHGLEDLLESTHDALRAARLQYRADLRDAREAMEDARESDG